MVRGVVSFDSHLGLLVMDIKKPRLGEPAPWFECRSPQSPKFKFHTVAGRYIVLHFFGSLTQDMCRKTVDAFFQFEDTFDAFSCSFFGVTTDQNDGSEPHFDGRTLGVHLFQDFNKLVSAKYGAVSAQGTPLPQTYVLDERLRIVANITVTSTQFGEMHVAKVLSVLSSLPTMKPSTIADIPAPVLIVPRVFEPAFCRELIKFYDERGGKESGYMQEIGGKTVYVENHKHKRRSDEVIDDKQLREACMMRMKFRLLPEIQKAFQFNTTRIERYIVACYDSATSGHFRAHRDNTTKGTAHRRFAVSINLNTDEYEGGELSFPEFGRQRYVVPAGGACVFSCSLLHEAKKVTKGSRYAFLPFLYDDAAAAIREENRQFIETNDA
ncbi:peroxiredoxin [Enterovibrio norvegicus]|nr:peroxiredoxin [Enterovibrio norvegicus]OEF55433.1 peroxiredoxin [Enterovibrio norvegicus]TKF35912.1 redoxin domain-containing protein [Enterovibrio norvegicus]